MDTGRRQHLQDIYATDHKGKDEFTPQVSNEIIEERKRDARRHQFTAFMLGLTVLALAVGLVFVVIKEYLNILQDDTAPPPIAQDYIPRHSLPSDAQWVLDLSRNYGDPQWNGEGERPFNTLWVKKAAWNIHMAEKALELAKANPDAYAQAAQYYEQAIEILPEMEGIKVPLGMVYFQLKDYQKALVLLENAPESELTFDVLNNLGVACLEAKAYDRAEEYLKRSLELKPAYADALKNLAMLYRKQDREEESIRAYEQFLDQRPMDDTTRYDFALYLTKAGNWKLAAEQLRTLSNQVTDDHYVYFLLARAENKLGNTDAATQALRRGIQLTDPKLAIAWMDDAEFDQLRNTPEFQSLMKYVQQQGL
ncbi:MAG: tetratricopeptide repeat protein [Pontiellaceae bacterium]|nr:tetratricopeptide repeat protein [Pontiellaceae bacterium]MBN2786517.1 tetratricopeptide repeat protein [Pontiellaceae bacterium]